MYYLRSWVQNNNRLTTPGLLSSNFNVRISETKKDPLSQRNFNPMLSHYSVRQQRRSNQPTTHYSVGFGDLFVLLLDHTALSQSGYGVLTVPPYLDRRSLQSTTRRHLYNRTRTRAWSFFFPRRLQQISRIPAVQV